MASIVATPFSPNPWRIRVVLDTAPSTTTSHYTISRTDRVSTTITVSLAWTLGTNVVELALSEAMLADVEYQVTVAGAGTSTVSYRLPSTPAVETRETDYAAERLGLDIAWVSSGGSFDHRKQVRRRTGLECLKHDLAAVAHLEPTELFHRPQAGAGLRRYVNANSAEEGQAVAAVRSAWTRDPRVRTGSVELDPRMDPETGELEIGARVIVDPTGEPIAVDTSLGEP